MSLALLWPAGVLNCQAPTKGTDSECEECNNGISGSGLARLASFFLVTLKSEKAAITRVPCFSVCLCCWLA